MRRLVVALLRWVLMPLMVGAFATIGLAWGFAAWLPQTGWREFHSWNDASLRAASNAFVVEYRAPGACRRTWEIRMDAADTFPAYQPVVGKQYFHGWSFTPKRLPQPDWGHLTALRSASLHGYRTGCEHATGWPFLSMWYEITPYFLNPSKKPEIVAGLPLVDQPPSPFGPGQPFIACDISAMRALPMKPIWSGIAADTAVYAGAFLVIRRTVPIRSWWRRHRGVCVACGYDLHGLPASARCSECGRARTS